MSDKLYARHYKLHDFIHQYKIGGYGLTSDIGKTDAYDLYHNDYLGKFTASSVLFNLRGAEKNASAFGLSTKGLLEFWKMFPEDKWGDVIKEQVFLDIFKGGDSAVLKRLRKNDLGTFHREYKEKMNNYWSSI